MTKPQYQRYKALGGMAAWATARSSALALALYRCENCGKTAQEVHHRTALQNGGNHHSKNLAALCRTCHKKAHGYFTFSLGQLEWQRLVQEVSAE